MTSHKTSVVAKDGQWGFVCSCRISKRGYMSRHEAYKSGKGHEAAEARKVKR